MHRERRKRLLIVTTDELRWRLSKDISATLTLGDPCESLSSLLSVCIPMRTDMPRLNQVLASCRFIQAFTTHCVVCVRVQLRASTASTQLRGAHYIGRDNTRRTSGCTPVEPGDLKRDSSLKYSEVSEENTHEARRECVFTVISGECDYQQAHTGRRSLQTYTETPPAKTQAIQLRRQHC